MGKHVRSGMSAGAVRVKSRFASAEAGGARENHKYGARGRGQPTQVFLQGLSLDIGRAGTASGTRNLSEVEKSRGCRYTKEPSSR